MVQLVELKWHKSYLDKTETKNTILLTSKDCYLDLKICVNNTRSFETY